MLFSETIRSDIGSCNKKYVKSRLLDSAYSSFKQVSRIFDKNLSRQEIKALDNLVKNKYLYKKQKKKTILWLLTEVTRFQN